MPWFDPAMVPAGAGLLAVIGDPIGHSLSPAMHTAAIRELGLPLVYLPIRVCKEDLAEALSRLQQAGCVGVNVTIPHKEAAFRWVCAENCDEEARAVQAVNTIHFSPAGPLGYSTDGIGFDSLLERSGIAVSGRVCAVIGAGGAARSIVYRLLKSGSEVILMNRSVDRAIELVEQLAITGGNVTCVSLSDLSRIQSSLSRASLLIQTTSVGMFPELGKSPIPNYLLHSGLSVVDLIYNPFETELLLAARQIGCQTVNGVMMLVGQGDASFRIWTGLNPPWEVMESAVVMALNQQMQQ